MPSSIVNYTRSDFRYQCQSAPIFLPEKFSFQYQLTATLSPTLLPPFMAGSTPVALFSQALLEDQVGNDHAPEVGSVHPNRALDVPVIGRR